jgi:hypothetical protein
MDTPMYSVRVSGTLLDPRTKEQAPSSATYRVAARRPEAARVAAVQLFTADASMRRRLTAGECHAVAEQA